MLRRFLASLAIGALILSPISQAHAASAFTDKQRAELDIIIKDYISKHPEVLISSVETHYNKQAESKQVQEGRLDELPADMVDANTPAFGPKDAKVTVVQFFDYNCGYCKQVATDYQKLIDEDKTTRFVFKELPILSDSSELASRYALAAHKQDKYLAYHNALMKHQGPVSEEFLIETAKAQGLNVDKMKTDANAQEFKDALAKNLDIARMLGVRGTPFFLIGKEKVPGAVGYSNLKEMIAKERGDKPADSAATVSSDTDATATSAASAPKADPETQAEIDKAKAEANAMIEELKAEAKKMQEEALAQKAKLEAEAAALAKKEAAEKAAAEKAADKKK